MNDEQLQKAAQRGAPSYVWRAGQQRRLEMIQAAAGNRAGGRVLVDGCGVGAYLARLAVDAAVGVGLDIELERAKEARERAERVLCAAGEHLPFPENTFDLVLSHEVLEHVQDDRQAIVEMVRVLAPGGRLVLFCPNRGYPFETHGIYWRGTVSFWQYPAGELSTAALSGSTGAACQGVQPRRPGCAVRRSAGEIHPADGCVRGV
jgi:SAM-dependent methyltransferase